MPTRRDLYRIGTIALGNLIALGLAVPGVAYVLSPLLKRREGGGEEAGALRSLARLNDLKVGVPQSFPIVAERVDAWVKYPPEPVGLVWLIRQPEGSDEPVVAYTAECPHLGCAVNLAPDGKGFSCPCHSSAFKLDGSPINAIPPRGLDRLDVELTAESDPLVRVRFRRFRTQTKERTPLA